jgi:hypothetical protein
MIDKINKVIAEEMPAQDVEIDNNEYDDEEDEAKQKEKEQKNELKIKIMQYLNPRIVKSKELKNYVDRSNIKEEIYKTLNSFAQQKLNAYKNAIALNLPVELGESDKFMPTPRQVPAPPGGLPVPKGYERVKSWGGAYELRRTAESLRDEHNELHTTPSEETEQLDEAKRNPNVMRQGRTKVIKARVRGGKVQRRKKVSAVKGYTIRGGKLKRMSAAERLRRKRGARIGKIKRKAKMSRAIMKRKRSLRKRASLGLKE